MKKKILKKNNFIDTKDYVKVLQEIKQQISNAQIKATLSANRELLRLYWNIGKIINDQQKSKGWGSKNVEKLSHDIQSEYPGLEGFSRRNIFRMQAFFSAYELVPQAVALLTDLPIFNIPWGHNAILLEQLKNNNDRFWYAQQAIENGWSRSILELRIKSNLHKRQGKAITNFIKTLPKPNSEIAQQTLKDPYIFDFLTLHEQHLEQNLEQGLIDHVLKLLLEMGTGFALVARQHHLEVGKKDFYIDLLFYHLKLKCYIVVELKARDFDPRDIGQLNFYLSAVDDLIRDKHDHPTIGLLLCKTKDNFTAEYALRDINKPIGVAEYQTTILKNLPKEFKGKLPTVAEIEAELEKSEFMKRNIKKARIKKVQKK